MTTAFLWEKWNLLAKVVNETNEYFIIGFEVGHRGGSTYLYSYCVKHSVTMVFTFDHGVSKLHGAASSD